MRIYPCWVVMIKKKQGKKTHEHRKSAGNISLSWCGSPEHWVNLEIDFVTLRSVKLSLESQSV